LNTSDLSKNRTKTRENRENIPKDYYNHRQSVNTERKFDDEYLQNQGRFSYSYQNEEGQVPLKTARLPEEPVFLTERTKGDLKPHSKDIE